MIKTQEREAQLTVKCPKCGEYNSPGIIHCAKCNKELMPLLAFITLLGLFLLVPITLAIGWTIPFSKEPTALLSCIIGIVGIFSLLGLRRGRYWAWTSIQFVGIIVMLCFATSAIWSLIRPSHPPDFVMAAIIIFLFFLVAVLLMAYIRSKRVRAFCCVRWHSVTQANSLMTGSFAIFILGLSVPVMTRNLHPEADAVVVSEHDVVHLSGNFFDSSNRVAQVSALTFFAISGILKAARPKQKKVSCVSEFQGAQQDADGKTPEAPPLPQTTVSNQPPLHERLGPIIKASAIIATWTGILQFIIGMDAGPRSSSMTIVIHEKFGWDVTRGGAMQLLGLAELLPCVLLWLVGVALTQKKAQFSSPVSLVSGVVLGVVFGFAAFFIVLM